jgi:HlyD family secretion protein
MYTYRGAKVRQFSVLLAALFLAACSHTSAGTTAPPDTAPQPPAKAQQRELRLTGIVEAIHSSKVMVPQIVGQNGKVTLTRLISNGTQVKEGDVIAEFDATQQLDAAFTARGKYEDLSHQVEQKGSQNRADAEKRRGDLTQAQADLRKAELELEKAPILSEIDQLKNNDKVEVGRKHVASLIKSNALHDQSDAAALRILELQRDRQKVAMDRAQTNIDRLQIRAPLAGMVAHQLVYRNNGFGHPQEGDQFWSGQVLVNIFDPSEMQVRCMVGEPDGAALVGGAQVKVNFDAYPDLAVPGHFESASPMAAAALGSPIKTFTAVFKLDRTEPRLMPDLSAAIVLDRYSSGGGK